MHYRYLLVITNIFYLFPSMFLIIQGRILYSVLFMFITIVSSCFHLCWLTHDNFCLLSPFAHIILDFIIANTLCSRISMILINFKIDYINDNEKNLVFISHNDKRRFRVEMEYSLIFINFLMLLIIAVSFQTFSYKTKLCMLICNLLYNVVLICIGFFSYKNYVEYFQTLKKKYNLKCLYVSIIVGLFAIAILDPLGIIFTDEDSLSFVLLHSLWHFLSAFVNVLVDIGFLIQNYHEINSFILSKTIRDIFKRLL